jgi:hypothetical protein
MISICKQNENQLHYVDEKIQIENYRCGYFEKSLVI